MQVGREAAHHVAAQDAVHLRGGRHRAHAVELGHQRSGDLPGGRLGPGCRRGVCEGRPVTSSHDARDHAERAHRHHDERFAAAAGRAPRELEKPTDVRDRARRHRDLHDVGTLRAALEVQLVEVLGGGREVVMRDYEAAPRLLHHHVEEVASVLDIHVVEAPLDRLQQVHPPAGLAVGPEPAFRGRAAGEEKRLGARSQDREQVEVEDQIAAHLEEVRHAGQLPETLDDPLGRLLGQADADLGHAKQESLFRVA